MRALLLTVYILISIGSSAQFICKKNIGASSPVFSAASSDSVNILHYTINLDFTDLVGQVVSGYTGITFTPITNNVNKINFDFLHLNVDSILLNGQILTYSYNDTVLSVTLDATYNIGDSGTILVYYNGSPTQDSQGQGGFYFAGNYAYNIGVLLNDSPHNGGRVWFPCFDNFTDRASYSFYIKTAGGKKAHCNGALINEQVISGDTIVRHWELQEEIPTYLACVSVANYATLSKIHNGNFNPVPIEIAAEPIDTLNVKMSFINLENAIDIFEEKYGPYQWNKVGYSIVPFQYGAMEHATNIAYPILLANGTTAYETVMAHELAHNWWGNLVTCERAEEMWLNEGWASYSEHLFLESLYSKNDYYSAVLDNHMTVIKDAHRQEGGYLALNNVPQDQTYGMHSYQKGALVAHNLRGYLGDSLFFNGIQAFLDSNKFTDINSIKLRDFLSNHTSVDLTDFFDGWVLNAGYPNFKIDSFSSTLNGSVYDIQVVVKQKLQSAPNFFNSVPLTITCLGPNFEEFKDTIYISGEYSMFSYSLPFSPSTVFLNDDNRILSATTADQKIVNSLGSVSFSRTYMSAIMDNLNSDSILLRLEKNWVQPDNDNVQFGVRLSSTHSWNVRTNMNTGDRIIGKIIYYDFFNSDLVGDNEDSLVVVFRANGSKQWKLVEKFSKDMVFSNTDGYGIITIDSLVQGEYTLANFDSSLAGLNFMREEGVLVYPNLIRTNDAVQIKNLDRNRVYKLTLANELGQEIMNRKIKSKINDVIHIDLNSGMYFLSLKDEDDNVIKTEKIQVIN